MSTKSKPNRSVWVKFCSPPIIRNDHWQNIKIKLKLNKTNCYQNILHLEIVILVRTMFCDSNSCDFVIVIHNAVYFEDSKHNYDIVWGAIMQKSATQLNVIRDTMEQKTILFVHWATVQRSMDIHQLVPYTVCGRAALDRKRIRRRWAAAVNLAVHNSK